MSRDSDLPRADFAAQREIPNRYSKLLQTVSRGHALFNPESNVHPKRGDGGYIDKGIFIWLFNVFDSPPSGIPGLQWSEPDDVIVQMQVNTSGGVLKSSNASTVKFRSFVGMDASVLPTAIPPIAIEPQVSLHESAFAFLAFAGVEREARILKRPRSARLKKWLAKHYEEFAAGNLASMLRPVPLVSLRCPSIHAPAAPHVLSDVQSLVMPLFLPARGLKYFRLASSWERKVWQNVGAADPTETGNYSRRTIRFPPSLGRG